MSKTIKIPDSQSPFVVKINNKTWSFPAGTTQTVDDDVAAVIENAIKYAESVADDPTVRLATDLSAEGVNDDKHVPTVKAINSIVLDCVIILDTLMLPEGVTAADIYDLCVAGKDVVLRAYKGMKKRSLSFTVMADGGDIATAYGDDKVITVLATYLEYVSASDIWIVKMLGGAAFDDDDQISLYDQTHS